MFDPVQVFSDLSGFLFDLKEAHDADDNARDGVGNHDDASGPESVWPPFSCVHEPDENARQDGHVRGPNIEGVLFAYGNRSAGLECHDYSVTERPPRLSRRSGQVSENLN